MLNSVVPVSPFVLPLFGNLGAVSEISGSEVTKINLLFALHSWPLGVFATCLHWLTREDKHTYTKTRALWSKLIKAASKSVWGLYVYVPLNCCYLETMHRWS